MAAKKVLKKKSHRKSSSRPKDDISQAALKLIDRTAALLRQGVGVASKKGGKAHKVFKKKAYSFVELATRRLHGALQGGSTMLKKGIKKM